MERRSFLKTLGAIAMTFVAPALAFAGFRRSRMMVNGVEVPFPKDGLDIVIEIAGEEVIKPVSVRVLGGILRIENPNGDAISINIAGEAMVEVAGSTHGISVLKETAKENQPSCGIYIASTMERRSDDSRRGNGHGLLVTG